MTNSSVVILICSRGKYIPLLDALEGPSIRTASSRAREGVEMDAQSSVEVARFEAILQYSLYGHSGNGDYFSLQPAGVQYQHRTAVKS